MKKIEVVAATSDDHKFEAGWHAFTIESDLIAPDSTASIRVVFDEACSIFWVTAAIEVLGLVIGGAAVVLDAIDRADEKKAWRVRGGHADVWIGAEVIFLVKNDGSEFADPRIAYVTRNHRRKEHAS